MAGQTSFERLSRIAGTSSRRAEALAGLQLFRGRVDKPHPKYESRALEKLSEWLSEPPRLPFLSARDSPLFLGLELLSYVDWCVSLVRVCQKMNVPRPLMTG